MFEPGKDFQCQSQVSQAVTAACSSLVLRMGQGQVPFPAVHIAYRVDREVAALHEGPCRGAEVRRGEGAKNTSPGKVPAQCVR